MEYRGCEILSAKSIETRCSCIGLYHRTFDYVGALTILTMVLTILNQRLIIYKFAYYCL